MPATNKFWMALNSQEAKVRKEKAGNPAFFISPVLSGIFLSPVAVSLSRLAPGLAPYPLPCRSPRTPEKSTPPPQTFGVFLTLLCNPRDCAKDKKIYGAKGGKRKLPVARNAAICK